jgi:hypothetical protein
LGFFDIFSQPGVDESIVIPIYAHDLVSRRASCKNVSIILDSKPNRHSGPRKKIPLIPPFPKGEVLFATHGLYEKAIVLIPFFWERLLRRPLVERRATILFPPLE